MCNQVTIGLISESFDWLQLKVSQLTDFNLFVNRLHDTNAYKTPFFKILNKPIFILSQKATRLTILTYDWLISFD